MELYLKYILLFIEATWMITVLSLVAGGVGVTFLPANAQNLQRTGVVYRPIQGKNLTRPIAAVWRSDDISVILQNFLQVIKDVVGAEITD
ncbi:LysR substrate-binding domain-containing protein [Anabaena sp. CCY 9402-a]|uniref:LysR substrate-binding domain-containing protein n=1 Tax=Anabaena sp. CCY 9402-a TaxID=3103867 RepID=UPI0039C5B936